MKITYLMFLLLGSFCLRAQDSLTIQNGEGYDPEKVAPFARELLKRSELVIQYRIINTQQADVISDYFILTKSGTKERAYKYLFKKQQLMELDLSQDMLELIWATFLQNELLAIKNEKDIPNFCLEKYRIYNSHTYEFVLLSKTTMKTLSYYDPEYYENACYGISERRNIINSAAVINYALGN